MSPYQRTLSSIATVLTDSGMRPEERFRLRWGNVTWINGRYGTLVIEHGKTAAGRRIIPRPDAWTLAGIAGHASITVSSRYVHPSEAAVLGAVERLRGHKVGFTENSPAVAAVAMIPGRTVQ